MNKYIHINFSIYCNIVDRQMRKRTANSNNKFEFFQNFRPKGKD